MSTSKHDAGFTLPELILLIIVLSIGITGILIAYNQSVRGSGDPVVRKQVIAVAESMMQEIQLMPFTNPSGGFSGAATQANRSQFDDIGDYDTFSTSGIFTIDGTAIPELAAYSVSVAVTKNVSLGTITAASGNATRITVTATGPGGTSFVLDGYRTNYP